jgi:metal-dependent amidase/aminoacylase/carboxypeptidase family protein
MLAASLQTLVSRETSPTDGAVVGVSRFNTGVRYFSEVIPDAMCCRDSCVPSAS